MLSYYLLEKYDYIKAEIDAVVIFLEMLDDLSPNTANICFSGFSQLILTIVLQVKNISQKCYKKR